MGHFTWCLQVQRIWNLVWHRRIDYRILGTSLSTKLFRILNTSFGTDLYGTLNTSFGTDLYRTLNTSFGTDLYRTLNTRLAPICIEHWAHHLAPTCIKCWILRRIRLYNSDLVPPYTRHILPKKTHDRPIVWWTISAWCYEWNGNFSLYFYFVVRCLELRPLMPAIMNL
jgi:hypothetical protein